MILAFLNHIYAQDPTPTVENIAAHTADINFTPVNGATGYEVAYRHTGESEYVYSSFSAPPYTISGLQAEYKFYIKVRSIFDGQTPTDWGAIDKISNYTTARLVDNPDLAQVTITANPKESIVDFPLETGATGYEIAYRNTGEAEYRYASFTTPPYTISDLTGNLKAYIKLRSTAADIEPIFWDRLEKKEFITSPDVPNPSNNDIVLNIAAHTTEVDFPLISGATSYDLAYRHTGDSEYIYVYGIAPPYTISGLTGNKKTYIKLRSVVENVILTDWDNIEELEFYTEPAVEDPIITISNITSGSSSAIINFTPITGAESYDVSYKNNLDGEVYTDMNFETPPFTLTGLLADTEIKIKVRSVAPNNVSTDWTEITSFRFSTANLAGDPNFVIAPGVFSASIDFPTNPDVASYEVAYRHTGDSEYIYGSFINPPYNITGLTANKKAYVKVRAIKDGQTPTSWDAMEKIPFDTEALPNPLFTIDNISATRAEINFSPVQGATSYQISYAVQGGTFTEEEFDSPPYVFSGLTANTTIEIKLRSLATNAIPNDWTNISISQFTTIVEELTFSNIQYDNVEMDYNLSNGAEYEIKVCEAGSNECSTQTTTQFPFVFAGLDKNTQYEAQVRENIANPIEWNTLGRFYFSTANGLTVDARTVKSGSICGVSGIISETDFPSNGLFYINPETVPGTAYLSIENSSVATQNISFEVDAAYNISNVMIDIGGVYQNLNPAFYRIKEDNSSNNSILELGPVAPEDKIVLNGLEGISFNDPSVPFSIGGLGQSTGLLEIYDKTGTLVKGGLTDFSWDGTDASGQITPVGNYKYKIILNQAISNAVINGDLIKTWQ